MASWVLADSLSRCLTCGGGVEAMGVVVAVGAVRAVGAEGAGEVGAAAEAVEPLISVAGLKWSSLSCTHSRVPSKRFSTNPVC